jgi:toxin ParE1/3/4
MIRWLPSAVADVATIYGYIVDHDPDAARRMVAKIFAAPARLEAFPMSGSERADIAKGLRSVAAGKYVILYRLHVTDVEIVRVLHGARDLAAAFAAGL